MKRFIPGFLTLGVTLLLAGSVHAVQLSGSFGIVGNFVPIGGNLGVPAASGGATALDFIPCNGAACIPPPNAAPPTPGVAGEFLVTSASGSFGTGSGNLNLSGLVGNIKDFTFFGSGSTNYPNVPVSAFEVVNLLSFDLATISILQQGVGVCSGVGATEPCLQLSGTGTFHAAGFDDTFGTWSFLGVRAATVGGFIETFIFTSNNAIPTVPTPEPSTMLLLGAGLVGLAFWGRKRISKSDKA